MAEPTPQPPSQAVQALTNTLRNAVNELTTPAARNRTNIILRYPDNVENINAPFVLFTRKRASYDSSATTSGKVTLAPKDHVSLYMPMGFSISDNMNYDIASTGIIGSTINQLSGVDVSELSMSDVKAAAEGAIRAGTPAVAGAAGAAATRVLPGGIKAMLGAVVGGVVGGGIGTSLAQEYQKRAQVSLNPREFMLFKSPSLRNFSFRFRFIPDSESESRNAEQIVRWFRESMYPDIGGAYTYNFPDAFQIEFMNTTGIPNIPELFLTSASVTYNPNSMSYFIQDNRPTEINLSLDFKEISPISRESIINGGF